MISKWVFTLNKKPFPKGKEKAQKNFPKGKDLKKDLNLYLLC
jgi:hypothetical protein